MPFTIESARSIFPNTLSADVVPATIARFNQLNTEDQLALIWFAYLEMGKSITIAAPGAASMVLAEPTLNAIRKMSPREQTQVMCDLANNADTPICRTYAVWSVNIKLGFWYQLGDWMADGSVAPIPEGYQLSANANAVLQAIRGLEAGQQITVLVDEPGIARSFREAPEIDGVVQVPESLTVGEFYEVTVEQVFGPDLVAAHDGAVLLNGVRCGR
jgi:TusA-related sulfurtransferase